MVPDPEAYSSDELRRIFENAVSPENFERILAMDPPLSPRVEIRTATAWFSDVRGATALEDVLGIEELIRRISALLEAITEAAIARGGYVDNYVGDEAMVIFGAPLAISEAEQARAAADLSLAAKQAAKTLDLEIGVGFNLGSMRFGCLSPRNRPTYTVLGDAVNVGARLESESKHVGNRPCVTSSIRYLIEPTFRCAFVDKILLQRIPETVDLYALIGERSRMTVEEIAFWDRYDEAVALVDQERPSEAFPPLSLLVSERPGDSLFVTALERARLEYTSGLGEEFSVVAGVAELAESLATSMSLLFGNIQLGLLEPSIDGLWRFREDIPFASRGILVAPEGGAMTWIRGLDGAALLTGAPEPLASSGFSAIVPLRKDNAIAALLFVEGPAAFDLGALDAVALAVGVPWASARQAELRERYREKASDAEKLEEVNRELERKSLELENALVEIGKLNAGLEARVDEAVARLDRASSLKRYLPPSVVDDIIEGRRDLAPRTERRKITVLFSDVHGFTEATDGLEPEELARLLDEYLSAMSDIAFAAGATIDKFRGDGMMVFFGAPEPVEPRDGALRCIRMARDMCRVVGTLREKWFNEGYDWDLGVRIGINTGYATVGEFGSAERMDYTAVGTEVNLASRLEGCCETDSIVISHATWALVKGEVECKPLGSMELKGIHRPVRVYEALWK